MVTNSHFRHTHFTPTGFDTTGHMLEVIVIKKDTLQIVDDHIDCPVGGIPDLAVIGPPGCGDADVDMGLLEIGDADLCLLGDGFVDHPSPVFFHSSGQLLQSRQRFRDRQADYSIRISLGDRHFPNDPFGCRSEIYHRAACIRV